MKPRRPRTADELERAAHEVCLEWITSAELVKIAEGFQGARSIEESAVITAIIVRYRCLVNFIAGNFRGQWSDNDIAPSDFLGTPWHPSDDDLDRTMRGRLRILNIEQQHISWKRLEDVATIWPVGFIVREVGVALSEFADALVQHGGPGGSRFANARSAVGDLLAARSFERITVVDLAPART